MNLARLILKLAGWKVDVSVPDYPKAIICVAPHTSNWDFIIGKLAIASVGRKAGFLMKKSWFFFPLGLILKSMGGIPVNRGEKKESLVETVVRQFRNSSHMVVAITPEGTRSRTCRWRTGFLNISRLSGVPILLAAFDYEKKIVTLDDVFFPTDNVEDDLNHIKTFYRGFKGRYPEKFCTDPS